MQTDIAPAMDKRSWPWKKKSSDKQAAEKANVSASDSSAAVADTSGTQDDKGKQDNNGKKPKYVQISVESYTRLTGLEDQVKSYEEQVQTLEDEVKELSEKLSEANSEITNKENLVKQHAKVAEEAISGWEKAEAEAATLKNHLESVTLLKLTAEDRASHLDGALKECMRQIRNLKEEHDKKLHEVVLEKTKLFDKMKLELEAQISNLDQQLLRSAAENAALSRSLQDRSNMLIKLSEEKSQAEAEIEFLKSNIESCEKEVNSLKYELHIAKKEVEIRNEEKTMSVRSAEVANKQHLEGVKKIAKLEAECQRLRGLVRKKLPGPAALAQMKLEVENLGRDYGESRFRRSPVKPPAYSSQLPEFSLDNLQKYQKENELLTERLLAMDEETKMLKEALARRNNELQTSRSICAQTASKLQSLESQLQANAEERSPSISNARSAIEGFSSKKACTPPSFTSISEDGNDDNISCAGSWATESLSELSYIKKEKRAETPCRAENTNHLDLMDDFLEMEKLAYLSHGSDGTVSNLDASVITGNRGSELVEHEAPPEAAMRTEHQSGDQHGPKPLVSSKEDETVANPQLHADSHIFEKLQLQISIVLESISKEKDNEKVIADIRCFMQDMLNTLHHHSVPDVVEAADCSGTESHLQTLAEEAKITSTKAISLSGDVNSCAATGQTINQELEIAISNIYDFVMIFGKEAKAVPGTSPDEDGLNKNLDRFSAKYSEAINSKIDLVDFVLDISHVLGKASELHFNVLGFKSSEVETGSPDCIDKIALPENKTVVDSPRESYPNGCGNFSDSASDPDVPNDANLVPTSESTAASWKCSLEEFERLKMDKDNLAVDLARCTENLESTKSQLQETEQLLSEVKSQLTSAQKSNSLAETQLKCMAESYRSLETRAEELQTEVNLLQGKIENLYNELQEEKRSHQDALTRCKDLQEQLERIESPQAADNDDKTSQEKELAAAAEKLAECQETIFLLGKQLKAFRPQTDSLISPNNGRSQKVEVLIDEEPTISGTSVPDIDPSEMDIATSLNLHRAGSESTLDPFNAPRSPSDSEANNTARSPVRSHHPIHRPTKSVSSSASSTPTPEKQTRGFSRFFSSKGKNAQ
ncbi:filament-like plant protein 4 isoform X1 [Sesamum indicum]|uniref:filament-like Plant protein 4 isoform X1 n=2 Tax=Sesamum indicum TaxID=4182 RepID=A0A6I9SVN9_SESIN|nr:filament-like plant protein 4 isoform X1 [Sesamum indicum]XP_011074659.1 filament-like plant protein 4 isoform X1 [Sesamum indicum]XP_011074660.1 filament-like plant protein 4 isoform X1 [Sesamum indicum]